MNSKNGKIASLSLTFIFFLKKAKKSSAYEINHKNPSFFVLKKRKVKTNFVR